MYKVFLLEDLKGRNH